MRRLAISLCAALACTPTSAPPEVAPTPAPAQQPAPAPPPAPANIPNTWQLVLTHQLEGAALGPAYTNTVDSTGRIKAEVDGKLVGESTLPPAEVQALAALLAAPDLRGLQPKPDMSYQRVHLVVTGDVALDITGARPETAAIFREVDRLRDLVAPPENFLITVTHADQEVSLSDNGYLKLSRGGTKIADHFLRSPALDKTTTLIASPQLRTTTGWPPGDTHLKISGDIAVDGTVGRDIKSPPGALIDEVLRLATLVEAKTKPPTHFTLTYTRQLHGAGLGPLVKISADSGARTLVLVDENPGMSGMTSDLSDDELNGLRRRIVDPDLRTAEPTPPSGEGLVYRIVVTGDAPLDVTYRGTPPPPATDFFNYLDHRARHAP